MKANELMLGDWVLYRGIPHRIFAIEADGMVKIATPEKEKEYRRATWPDRIEPVSLTPEILEKNGFIKDAYKDDSLTDAYHLLVPTGFERNSFTIQVSLYKEPICGVSTLVKCWGWLPPNNGGMNDIHLCSANYVHELQHVLMLCGIEKEITI